MNALLVRQHIDIEEGTGEVEWCKIFFSNRQIPIPTLHISTIVLQKHQIVVYFRLASSHGSNWQQVMRVPRAAQDQKMAGVAIENFKTFPNGGFVDSLAKRLLIP